MFINHAEKFVFVAVPKTATTTIQIYLNQPKVCDPGKHPHFMEKYHYSYRWILNDHPEATDYFSFGFTRNPWDRMVSSWIEFTSDKGQLDVWSRDLTEFRNFEDFVLNFSNTRWAQEIHFQPASWYLGCATEQVDFIGRYENLNEDFRTVLSKLGRPVFDIVSTRKFRKTNRDSNYHSYYTDKMVEIVGSHFHDDIINFGYTY